MVEKAAKQGNDKAQFNLERMYYLGIGVSQDHPKAKAYLNQAYLNKLQNACNDCKLLK
ncbi:unnamed protein product [Commensalibacter communis]|uniref:Sel1 repeat-containing protein n=1 Tax=Commensalibacter communis TaxID=2972786 RepID=A0A9W4TQC4_9PROT|nr:hypothetical protein [Commensalibacter communis]CAI3923231.1 unnamed protein product [Commensalibacter communis]CAI3923760.1 unnamed protein product [Commensalibacter communis]CAI3935911.1 unnamed protein product [Commensalibacter communis]CAI3945594.1 unnamed protein product [Commensalibacter communis]CAI3946889.1 unnamed protein product [Commensalibacter communis]